MRLPFQCLGVLFLIGFALNSVAQNEKYSNNIYSSSIKSLKANVEGNDQSYPAIELFSDAKILIQFDDLISNTRDYSYQIIHCNYDWTVSELFSEEFMDGFNENPILDYEYSTNTKQGYINYAIKLPNEDVQLKVAGNYVIRVIENGDRDNTILTVRFMVYEPLVRVDAEIIRPLGAQIQNNSHEIRLSINHEQLEIGDPFNEVKVVIDQNNRPDRTLVNIKPVFVKNNELVYSFLGENTLLAGNEFRTFGFTNIHKYGINVNDIQFVDTIYHVQLRLDQRRSYRKYFWEEDMNGNYFVYLDNSLDPYQSADYAFVYFSLPMEEPMLEGKVYVYGELNQWKTNETNMMHYNFETKMYEATLLLKQGYYDYVFAYYNNYTQELDEAILEGSHYQTENNYIVYVYHRNFADNFDRLVGYKVVNSKYQD